jgi:hypothetical protein
MKGSKSRAGDGDGVQPAREPGDIHRTAATGDLFAAAKYDHRRNASDVESRGKCRLVFRRVAVSAHYVNAAGHRSPITSVQRRVSQMCPARSQAAGAEGRASARVYRPGALQREKSYA